MIEQIDATEIHQGQVASVVDVEIEVEIVRHHVKPEPGLVEWRESSRSIAQGPQDDEQEPADQIHAEG